MKRYLILVAIVVSACSSSQAPVVPNPIGQIPNLSIIDTLDFGIIPVGTSKSMTIQFKNAGSDTLNISQSLSVSKFTTGQSSFLIAPGNEFPVTINFTNADTLPHIAYDTVRVKNNYHIIVLRSSWKLFSSMFLTAPKYIQISLSGLIGQWDGNAQSNIDFAANDFGQSDDTYINYDFVQSGDTIQFRNTYYFVDSYVSANQPCAYDSHSTTVLCALDTVAHSIEWIKASYTEDDESMYGACGHGTKGVDEVIIAHNIPLVKNGSVWSALLKSAALASTIDNVEYNANSSGVVYPYENTQLLSITGYDTTATLSLSIQ